MEITPDLPTDVLRKLKSALGITDQEIFTTPSPLKLTSLMALYKHQRDDLKDPSFNPRLPPRVVNSDDIFRVISDKDLMVHHPFESFYTVT